MDASKSRGPTAIQRPLGTSAVIAALKAGEMDGGGYEPQMENDSHEVAPRVELTSDNVSTYLQGLSGNPNDEIEVLIDELCRLREKLATDRSRIEQSIVEFASLNKSIMRVTKLIFERFAQMPSGDLPAAG